MYTFLESRWLVVSLLILFVLITAVFFMQNITSELAIGILVLGFGMSLLFITRRNRAAYIRDKITREKMYRNIVFEILALVLILFLAGMASRYVASYAGAYVESHWQGLGMIAGFIAAIAVSFAVGFGVKWGIGKMNKLI